MALAVRGWDCSWDPPDQACMKSAGFAFLVRYASRDPSQAGKNLTKAELDSALAKGLKVCVVWQDSKSQMKGGYSAGQSHAGSADSFARNLGLSGIPVYFSCDFDPVSSDWGVIDGYMNGVISVIGKPRTGGYGGYSFIKRQLDAGRMAWGWQTYAWSGTPTQWDSRAQLRQVKNDYARCGGTIDDDEAWASDYGQWPRPAAASGADESPSSVILNGQLHMACTWHDGRVNYQSPDEDIAWYAVDPVSANKARSGAAHHRQPEHRPAHHHLHEHERRRLHLAETRIGPPRELGTVQPRRRRPVTLFTCCSPSFGREVMPKCVF